MCGCVHILEIIYVEYNFKVASLREEGGRVNTNNSLYLKVKRMLKQKLQCSVHPIK